MAVDLATALTIALPISTGIVMAGAAVLRLIDARRKNNHNGSPKDLVTRPEMLGILKDKLKNVVYGDTCETQVTAIKELQKAQKEAIDEKIEDTQEILCGKIEAMKNAILLELKNHSDDE